MPRLSYTDCFALGRHFKYLKIPFKPSHGGLEQPGVSAGAWQECKNQMTSNGNSRAVGGRQAISLALINIQSIQSYSLYFFSSLLAQLVSQPGSASPPPHPECWAAAWFWAYRLRNTVWSTSILSQGEQ
ncbi:Hypothetical predicted protein [Xyrichtys novacula]|uniref:Uncharacterized protein n=1 Tax=Xyrichtys novacula TaxID=13765 RepID=A0AAV1GRY0_XYRNO|nr:Hypothetical predicted protein [Xyrichtys novacula]